MWLYCLILTDGGFASTKHLYAEIGVIYSFFQTLNTELLSDAGVVFHI